MGTLSLLSSVIWFSYFKDNSARAIIKCQPINTSLQVKINSDSFDFGAIDQVLPPVGLFSYIILIFYKISTNIGRYQECYKPEWGLGRKLGLRETKMCGGMKVLEMMITVNEI